MADLDIAEDLRPRPDHHAAADFWMAVAAFGCDEGLHRHFAGVAIPGALAEDCRGAYREFRRLQHALRLNGAQYARVPLAQVATTAAADYLALLGAC